jgi:hypothetical protein
VSGLLAFAILSERANRARAAAAGEVTQ